MGESSRGRSSSAGRVRWKAGDDPLASILRSLPLEGTVFCRAELSAPWGLEFEPRNHAHFHVLQQGSAWLRLRGEELVHPMHEGALVLIPQGGGHVLADSPMTRPVPIGSLVKPVGPGRSHNILQFGGGGETTRLVCGAFRFGLNARHPLLALLPPAIRVEGSGKRPVSWLEPILDFLADEARQDEPGAETIISRLTDILFVQAVRAWMESQPQTERGWLGALRDPQVGRSLALIHRYPERPWTVAALASEVAMSRSPFSVRFTSLVGEGPLSYLRRWRLQRAGDLLAREPLTVGEIAARVGYQSDAALSRAFHREWGLSPSAYRRREATVRGAAAR